MGTLEVTNPSTGENIGSVPTIDIEAAREMLERARRAQKRWEATPIGERARVIKRFRDLLLDRADEVCTLLSRENGGLVGALPLRQFTVRLENDRTDRLYMATQSGLVTCIREKGSGFPLYHMFPDRRPILPEFAPEAGDEKATPPAEPAEKEATPPAKPAEKKAKPPAKKKGERSAEPAEKNSA